MVCGAVLMSNHCVEEAESRTRSRTPQRDVTRHRHLHHGPILSSMARSTHRKRPEQLTLDSVRYHSGRGGPRHGAGRPRGIRPRVMHRHRERIVARVPVHVTIRLRSGIPTLRQPRFVRRFRSSLSEACVRHGFRVVHYSIQRDHVHLLIEAHTNHSIACGMKSVGARIGKLANRLFQRKGKVLDGRYHLRPLTHTARGASRAALCVAQSPASRRAAAQTRPSDRSRESPTRSRQFRPLVRRLAHRHRPSEPYRHLRSRPRTNLAPANRLAPPRAHPSRGRSLKGRLSSHLKVKPRATSTTHVCGCVPLATV